MPILFYNLQSVYYVIQDMPIPRDILIVNLLVEGVSYKQLSINLVKCMILKL